ncbi:PKD domain-containing protein [bacterium]|nr:PKD domain-containing protein [bacterium]
MKCFATPFVCALALLLTLVQAGCGKSASAPGGISDARSSAPAAISLPAPAELLSQRSTSAATLTRNGADFDASLPSRGVTVSGDSALFAAPDFGVSPPLYSFAVYRFNLEGTVPGSLELFSGFNIENVQPALALANWTENRWDWNALASSDIPGADNIAPDGTVLIAVVIYNGVLGYELQRLTFAAYDEVEDNDTPATANPLPGANFSGFRGNSGNYDEIPGYDGDGEDWFTLTDTFEAGQPLNLGVAFQVGDFGVAEGEVTLEVYSTADVLLATGNNGIYSTACELIYGTDFTDVDLPLKLRVYCDPTERFEGGDYYISSRSGFAPTAVLAVDKFVEAVPSTLTFDASGSTDPDGDIVEYEWDYAGPGEIEADDIITTVPQLEVEWTVPGAYNVTLTVRDATNYISVARDVILLGPNPFDEIEPNDIAQPLDPAKSSGWKGNTGRDETVAVVYDGTDDYFSILVPAGQSARFAVETTAGDGVFVQGLDYFSPGKNSGLTLYWDSAYQLRNSSGEDQTFFVQVGEGFSGHNGGDYTLTWSIGVEPDKPVIVASTTEGTAPLSVDFTIDDLNDPDGTVERYEWDFNSDGTVDATTVAPSFSFTETGNISVRLMIFDDDGLRNSDTQTIVVN